MSGMSAITGGGLTFTAARASDIVAAEERRYLEAQNERIQTNPITTSLVAMVTRCYQEATDHYSMQGITSRITLCLRMCRRQYDAEMQAAIKAQGGTDLYFGIANSKIESAQAWLTAVLAPSGDYPFAIAPTPIPSLPQDYGPEIAMKVQEEMAVAMASGQQPPSARDLADHYYDLLMKQVVEEANERADRMQRVIEDYFAEGGYIQALRKVIFYLVRYPMAILKGPFVQPRRSIGYDMATGQPVVREPKPTLQWAAVDPSRFWVAPNTTDIGQSWVIEEVWVSAKDLAARRDLPGWHRAAIDAAITSGATAQIPTHSGAFEQAMLQQRDVTKNAGAPAGMLHGYEYHGPATGNQLQEIGLTVSDPAETYSVSCLVVNGQCVWAMLNADKLQRPPYYITSFFRQPTIPGEGLPERLEAWQRAYNACIRALVDNLSLSSGPMSMIDVRQVVPEQVADLPNIRPWKTIFRDSERIPNERAGAPIEYFQPDSHADELIRVAAYLDQCAESDSGIPKFVQGIDSPARGAASTASGLSMMMSAASKTMQEVVRALDEDIIRPSVERTYEWLLFNYKDNSVKGDCKVVPSGAGALLLSEQKQLFAKELLQIAGNPTDLQIIGVSERRKLLEFITKQLGIEGVVPTEEELKARVQQNLQEQYAAIQNRMTPQQPQQPNQPGEAAA